ncbi:MAG: hypothetical protein GY798_14125 [Hyphomicrobiales bacterium]|nr:hypothetical protein [Hyphomicrobiales bacterium]
MRTPFRLTLPAVIALLMSPAAFAADRVALVIGNGSYQVAPALLRSTADAADLAEAFDSVGFDVTLLTDADARRLRSAFRSFEQKADDASVAVIYFTGHAIVGDGVNYLLPVDARLALDSHIDDEGVPLSRLVAALSGADDLRLMVIESAGRLSALQSMKPAMGKRRVGFDLAPVDLSDEAVVALVGPAVDAVVGDNEGNGVYAAALLAHLQTEGLDHGTLLERVHADVMNVTGGRLVPVVFGSIGTSVPVVPDTKTLAALDDRERSEVKPMTGEETERAFRRAESLGTVEAWDSFLQFCPDDGTGGIYCSAAATTRQKLLDGGAQSKGAPAIVGDGASVAGRASIADLRAVIEGETPTAKCDRLAAHSFDPDKPVAVVGTDLALLELVADTAIAVCTAAVDAHPEERRYALQLGRALHAAERFDEAFDWYERAAEAGSTTAMSNIGFLHASGGGVPVDYDLAGEWYRRAAEAGNVAAMGNLATLYQNGAGLEQDLAEARRWYGEAAAGGNEVAMNALALLNLDGLGGPQDLDEARRLLQEAADLGLADAVNNLGQLYNYGRGVPIDYVQARQHYERAADLGSSAAMVNLGILYENAQGVPGDDRLAREWYEKAAELGDAAAMTNLAYLYDRGQGVPVDKVKAREWYLKGAEAGNGAAMASIGYLYANGQGELQDHDKAMEWYRRGADIGNAEAMANVGFMYENGWGVPADMEAAREWYERAAAAGNAIAMANLGLIFENGRGVEASPEQAFEWYSLAAQAGNAQSMTSLGYFYTNGIGVEADEATALEWYTRAANLGNTIAMHNLGIAYKDGLGTERNLRRATDLFILSMRANNGWTFDQFRDNPENYPVEVLTGIERYLIGDGLLGGEADGVVDDDTRAALDALQAAAGR